MRWNYLSMLPKISDSATLPMELGHCLVITSHRKIQDVITYPCHTLRWDMHVKGDPGQQGFIRWLTLSFIIWQYDAILLVRLLEQKCWTSLLWDKICKTVAAAITYFQNYHIQFYKLLSIHCIILSMVIHILLVKLSRTANPYSYCEFLLKTQLFKLYSFLIVV